MGLYKDKISPFHKTAAFSSRVSETPENWPQELTSELYKQLPYLSDYDVNVNLDRVEPQRGFAFGYADIHNKTERPESEHQDAGMPHVRIPLVVQEHFVKPFSVMLDGERVTPLNEDRIREQLFNPSAFDLSVVEPSDPSLVEQLMPPHRSGIGMGGDYKVAAADLSMMSPAERKFVLDGLKEKKACETSNSLSPDESLWLKKFKGTAFEDRAMSLERSQVKLDLAENLRQQHREPSPPPPRVEHDPLDGVREKLRLKKRQLELELQLHNLAPKEKEAFVKEAFKHISKEQWDAMYNSLEIQKMVQEYGDKTHPAVQNKVYEMAAKIYGFHPKPEPPPPGKLQEYHQKLQEKQQKASEKQHEKAKKMVQEGTKMMSKKSSAESLLLKIAHTIRTSDWDRFVEAIGSDANLVAGFRRSGTTDLLTLVEEEFSKSASVDDRFQAIVDNIAPTVVTIQKLPGGDFLVKSASNEAFAPNQEAQGEVVPQDQMAQNIGQNQAQSMLPGQTATAVADPVEAQEPEVPSADVASQFGEYLVQDLMGNQIMGWVFPTTMAWDGEFSEQPVALFTNGSSFSLQDSVAGELIGKSPQLPMTQPRGEGVFYEVSRDGARATAPVTVRSGMTGPEGGEMYACQDMFGNQFTVHLSEGLTQPMRVSDNEYAVPNSWKFMALNNQTQLVPDGQQMNKTSAALREESTVTLYWNGAFQLEGGCGVEKLAEEYRQDLDPVSAEFALGLLGISGVTAKQKIAQARKQGVVKMAGLKSITLLGERYQAATKTAAALAAKIPDLRQDLVKEASDIDDSATVDKVLALNFVNPENLSTFVDQLPVLEETSENLASMLLSSYLGMQELPEASVERAMRGMEETILQLKSIQHAES